MGDTLPSQVKIAGVVLALRPCRGGVGSYQIAATEGGSAAVVWHHSAELIAVCPDEPTAFGLAKLLVLGDERDEAREELAAGAEVRRRQSPVEHLIEELSLALAGVSDLGTGRGVAVASLHLVRAIAALAGEVDTGPESGVEIGRCVIAPIERGRPADAAGDPP